MNGRGVVTPEYDYEFTVNLRSSVPPVNIGYVQDRLIFAVQDMTTASKATTVTMGTATEVVPAWKSPVVGERWRSTTRVDLVFEIVGVLFQADGDWYVIRPLGRGSRPTVETVETMKLNYERVTV